MGKSWYDFSPDNFGLESLLVCTQNQNRNYILQQENIVSLYCVWPSVFCWVLLVHNFKGSYYDELDFPWSLDSFFFFYVSQLLELKTSFETKLQKWLVLNFATLCSRTDECMNTWWFKVACQWYLLCHQKLDAPIHSERCHNTKISVVCTNTSKISWFSVSVPVPELCTLAKTRYNQKRYTNNYWCKVTMNQK